MALRRAWSAAVAGNNLAATLEEKPDRDAFETEGMLTAAQGGLHHWKLAGGWMEEERAEYRLARSLLQAGDPSKGSGQTLILDPDRHEATLAGQPLVLTPTEFDLLHALMASPGHAFTRAELIERALGYTYEGMDRTVDSHIKNLRRKIEPDPADPTFIQTVYGVGYRFQGEGS